MDSHELIPTICGQWAALQDHNRGGSRSGSTHLKVTTEGGQGQDRPTSRSQPEGVKVRIDPPQGHNRGGSRSGSTHLKVTTEGGQGQDRPTSRSQPRGVKVRIDPPQGHNRGGSRSGSTHLKVTTEGGQGQDRPTSRSQPRGSRSDVSSKDDSCWREVSLAARIRPLVLSTQQTTR